MLSQADAAEGVRTFRRWRDEAEGAEGLYDRRPRRRVGGMKRLEFLARFRKPVVSLRIVRILPRCPRCCLCRADARSGFRPSNFEWATNATMPFNANARVPGVRLSANPPKRLGRNEAKALERRAHDRLD